MMTRTTKFDFFGRYTEHKEQAQQAHATLDENIQALIEQRNGLLEENATLAQEVKIANEKYAQDKAIFNQYKQETEKNQTARTALAEKLSALQAGLRNTAETLPTLIVGKQAQFDQKVEQDYAVENQLSDEENNLYSVNIKRSKQTKNNLSSSSSASLYQLPKNDQAIVTSGRPVSSYNKSKR